MKSKYKIKRILFFVLFLLFLFSSCDEINGVMGLLPRFDSNLPNNISGTYVYFESEEAKDKGEYNSLLCFDSKEGTFTYTFSNEEGVKTERGKYKILYKTYKTTECNGNITFVFEDGREKDSSFYWYASALSGPEYLMLDDGRTYLYW